MSTGVHDGCWICGKQFVEGELWVAGCKTPPGGMQDDMPLMTGGFVHLQCIVDRLIEKQPKQPSVLPIRPRK